METVFLNCFGNCEVRDSGLGEELAVWNIQFKDILHAFGGDNNSSEGGDCATAQTSSGTANGIGDLVLDAPSDDLLNFLGVMGENDSFWGAFFDGVGIAIVGPKIGWFGENLLRG